MTRAKGIGIIFLDFMFEGIKESVHVPFCVMRTAASQGGEVAVNRRFMLLFGLGLMGTPIYAADFSLPELLAKAGLNIPGTDMYTSFLCQFLGVGALYLAGLWIAFRQERRPTKGAAVVGVILFFALLYRLLLIPGQPRLSTDMYRYIWDGRVQAQGINPYRYPPADQALDGLRDEIIYPGINRKEAPTIYPSGAQMLFHALNRLGATTIVALKAAVVLVDMGSVILLIMILASLGLNATRVLVYAWNPLVIYELGGSGHLDGFVVFFVLAALLFFVRDRPTPSILSLAVAASLKLYPAVILPALLRNKEVRGLVLFFLVLLLIYLPYLTVGEKVLGFLPEYFANPEESFNLGLKGYLLSLFPTLNQLVVTGAFACALSLAAGIVWLSPKEKAAALKFAYLLASLHIVLASASLHPWYVIWIIPFLALFPSPAWLYFSLAVAFSYLYYGSWEGRLPEWVTHLEYIPFFIMLAGEALILLKPSGGPFPWRGSAKGAERVFGSSGS